MLKFVKCYLFGFLWAALIALFYIARWHPGLEAVPSEAVTAGILTGALIPAFVLTGIDKHETPRMFETFVQLFAWTGSAAGTFAVYRAFGLWGLGVVFVGFIVFLLANPKYNY